MGRALRRPQHRDEAVRGGHRRPAHGADRTWEEEDRQCLARGARHVSVQGRPEAGAEEVHRHLPGRLAGFRVLIVRMAALGRALLLATALAALTAPAVPAADW